MTLGGLQIVLEEALMLPDWRVLRLEGEDDKTLTISRIEALDLLIKLERFVPQRPD